MNYKDLQARLKEMGATIPLNSPKDALQKEYERLSSPPSPPPTSAIVHSPTKPLPLESLSPQFEVVATERTVKMTEYVNVYMDTGETSPIYTQCWLTISGYASTCTRLPERVRAHLGSDVPVLGKVTLDCAVKRNNKIYESSIHVASITPSGIEVSIEARCELNPDEIRDIEKVLAKKYCLHNRVLMAHSKAGKSEDRVSSRKRTARKMKF